MKSANIGGDCISELLRAAEMWWHGKCPYEYTKADHFLNPEVNCVGANEKRLAKAVAGFYRPVTRIGK